jgi:hypothetical protein
MPMSLQQVAHMTGLNRTAIMKAIKRGALSGSKDNEGSWQVDGAELARFCLTNAQPNTHNTLAAARLKLAEERITDLKQRLDEMRQELVHARTDADDWKQQAKAITYQGALPTPQNENPLSWWQWLRTTG